MLEGKPERNLNGFKIQRESLDISTKNEADDTEILADNINSMRRKRGFTLVELLIVIIITAVLATLAVPKFADSALRAREARLKSYLRMLREATNRFHADTMYWPKSADIINGTTPTQGYDDAGNLQTIRAGTYFGPYLDKNGIKIEISGVALGYGTGAPYQVGSWRITGTGRAQDGTLYSNW